MTTQEDRASIYAMLDEAEQIIETISEAFGVDHYNTTHATKVFQTMVVDPTNQTVKTALMYLRWCLNYPARIGKVSEKREEETCGDCGNQIKCEGGFILEDEEAGSWRPCYKLLPLVHDAWQRETKYLYPT